MQAGHNKPSFSQAVVVTLINLFFLIVLSTSGCGLLSTDSSTLSKAESAFREMIGVPIEPRIRLLTEQDEYHRQDDIGIWVENRSNYTLSFRDQSLGLEAYQYDEQEEAWKSVDLGFILADPQAIAVKPGPRTALPSVSIPVEWIKASGKIRLVITGMTDFGQELITYKDIEIVD
jgi:hypothetical protein